MSNQPVNGHVWTHTSSPEGHRGHLRVSLHRQKQLLRKRATGVTAEGHLQSVDASRGDHTFIRTNAKTAAEPAGWPGQPEGSVDESFICQLHLNQRDALSQSTHICPLRAPDLVWNCPFHLQKLPLWLPVSDLVTVAAAHEDLSHVHHVVVRLQVGAQGLPHEGQS